MCCRKFRKFVVPLWFFTIAFFPTHAFFIWLVPMDEAQTDHLKAYGLIFSILTNGNKVYWLLNYRCGAFVADGSQEMELKARERGVSIEEITHSQWARILETVEKSN